MLKISANPSFWSDCQITVPGEPESVTIQLLFKHVPRDEIQPFFASFEGMADDVAIAKFVLDWKQVDVPFSADALKSMLQSYPAAAMDIFKRYRKELLSSKVKN